MGADDAVEISARPVPQEPMYREACPSSLPRIPLTDKLLVIANLGMSTNFGYVDEDHLPFPTSMYIEYATSDLSAWTSTNFVAAGYGFTRDRIPSSTSQQMLTASIHSPDLQHRLRS